LLADCCIHLEKRQVRDDVTYAYALEADYLDTSSDTYLAENKQIRPSLIFTKQYHSTAPSQTYYLEIFGVAAPRYMTKKKIREYIEYLMDNEWQNIPGVAGLPIALLAFPSLAEMIYARRHAKSHLNELWDMPDNTTIRLSTIEKLRTEGLTAVIWEDV